ncbi:MAG TPA: glycosyltransferase family 4 protein [Gaiellaceae bacterium]|jgi:glycosyltransferase involved in cell wall biosynthesis|nr:glycosyltransferase family 4 protein [Gaiellaceae bacterium]
MRVVLTIHHTLDRNSGSPGSTIALAEAYERAGHEVELLSFDDLPGRLSEQARMLAFPAYVARRLAGPLGRRCDVVDASSGDTWLVARARRLGLRATLVTRSHGLEHREHLERLADRSEGRVELSRRYFAYHGGQRLREVAISLRRADLTFFLNRDDLEYAVAELGTSRWTAHLVRNGIATSLLGLPSPQGGGRGDGPRIALIARHTNGMGAGYYVPALERILTQHPGVRVTLLGSNAPAGDVLGDFAGALRSRISVVPHYNHAELPRLLAGHEILVSAKVSEGFGKALVEGMACGLAPVTWATGGPSMILEHERTGLLVPPRDLEAWIAAVCRLIESPMLRLRLRREAHAAAQHYSWDATAAHRLGLIEAARGTWSGAAVERPPREAGGAASSGGPQALADGPVEPHVGREQVA